MAWKAGDKVKVWGWANDGPSQFEGVVREVQESDVDKSKYVVEREDGRVVVTIAEYMNS